MYQPHASSNSPRARLGLKKMLPPLDPTSIVSPSSTASRVRSLRSPLCALDPVCGRRAKDVWVKSKKRGFSDSDPEQRTKTWTQRWDDSQAVEAPVKQLAAGRAGTDHG